MTVFVFFLRPFFQFLLRYATLNENGARSQIALLVGYVAGYAYSWLWLQCVTAVRYGLSEAVQSVPVSEGWWSAPYVVFEPTPYPAHCWQAIAQSVNVDILTYELSFAVGATEDQFVLQ